MERPRMESLSPNAPTPLASDHRLWRGHAATPNQQKRHGKATQASVLIQMLRDARANGASLSLPSIMRSGIAQHGARFAELRERGFVIENRMERVDGAVHSDYMLTFDPERDDPAVEP